jgi:Zn-finger domain-containing protein
MSLTGLKKDASLRFNRVTREMREENKKRRNNLVMTVINHGRKKKKTWRPL